MNAEPPRRVAPQLIRAIGRWSMVALAVNCIIGGGIFGLPSEVAAVLGAWSPAAVLIAGLAMAVIVGCYAEVASQFTETGGHYIYVRRAFGRLAGIEVGWLNLLTRLSSGAAAVNLLVISLKEFWPAAGEAGPRCAIITLLIGTLAGANVRGVTAGTFISNLTTIAKLVPLLLLCAVGLTYIAGHPHVAQAPAIPGVGSWLDAVLLMFFGYGGYDVALTPMGEAADPRRDVAFALSLALLVVTFIYTTLQLVVVEALPAAAASERPLADVARVMMGRGGAVLVSIGTVIAVCGYLSANLLAVPRSAFALAERGDFPAALAAVHPRFRTPYAAIAVFALCVWLGALFGSFAWNVTLSAVARLFYFAAVCAAVPVLRRRQPGAARFRLPGGAVLPALGVLICATLVTRVDFSKSLILLAVIAGAFLNWLLVRRRGTML